MAKKIDWMYFRKSCVTCKRAKAHLDAHKVAVLDTTDAIKIRKGRPEALALAHTASKIIVAKGKKLVEFDMKKNAPDDDTLIAHLLGPTGNLRAPTAQVGKTLYVGFTPESYASLVG